MMTVHTETVIKMKTGRHQNEDGFGIFGALTVIKN